MQRLGLKVQGPSITFPLPFRLDHLHHGLALLDHQHCPTGMLPNCLSNELRPTRVLVHSRVEVGSRFMNPSITLVVSVSGRRLENAERFQAFKGRGGYMSLASRLVLEAEIETATRLEQLLTRDHRQTATSRRDHSMALGPSPTAVVDFGAVKIQ